MYRGGEDLVSHVNFKELLTRNVGVRDHGVPLSEHFPTLPDEETNDEQEQDDPDYPLNHGLTSTAV